MKEQFVCNFDNVTDKRLVLRRIGTLSGLWRIELVRYRARRTDAQNRYYFGVLVTAFADYLSEQDYEITTREHAHELIKGKFLIVDVVHPTTGESIGRRVRSTTELSVEEFSEYIDRCRAWLLDFFGIIVPDPEPFIPEAVAC